MLVLSRRCGEWIVINDCIRVMVVDVQGKRVRLGIEAPETVKIRRPGPTPTHPQNQPDAEGQLPPRIAS